MRSRKLQKKVAQQRALLQRLTRWRASGDRRCDLCSNPRAFHVPLCAEPDPVLITCWVSACEGCVVQRDLGDRALVALRSRGWGWGGVVIDEEPPQPQRAAAR